MSLCVSSRQRLPSLQPAVHEDTDFLLSTDHSKPNMHTHTHTTHTEEWIHMCISDQLPDNKLEKKSLCTICAIQKESTSDSSFAEHRERRESCFTIATITQKVCVCSSVFTASYSGETDEPKTAERNCKGKLSGLKTKFFFLILITDGLCLSTR